MWAILSGLVTDGDYSKLSAADRRAIIEILRDTKKTLPRIGRAARPALLRIRSYHNPYPPSQRPPDDRFPLSFSRRGVRQGSGRRHQPRAGGRADARALHSRGGEHHRGEAGKRPGARSGPRSGSALACTRIRQASSPVEKPKSSRWFARSSRRSPRRRAVGEIGLDYHYDFAPRTRSARGLPAANPSCARARFAHHHPHARSRG